MFRKLLLPFYVIGVNIWFCSAISAQGVDKLVAGDGDKGDSFGYSVALSGSFIFVGAHKDEAMGNESGSVYVFERTDDEWREVTKLTASDAESGDHFGHAVSVSGNYAVVSALHEDEKGDDSGAVYVFKRVDGVWQEIIKLTASDGDENDQFGQDVAIVGDYIIVGADRDEGTLESTGSVYIFYRVDETWGEVTKLTASDGQNGDAFGYAVSIDGECAVVGAFGSAGLTGAAYVFERIDGVWQEVSKLTAADGDERDRFGISVPIDGSTILIGAHTDESGEDELGNPVDDASGSVYVFERFDGTWQESAKLTASDADEEDRFGFSISIHGDRAIVGAHMDEAAGDGAGAAYLFERTDGAWLEKTKFTAFDAGMDDRFGYATSIGDDHVVIGAYADDDDDSDVGSVYVYALNVEYNFLFPPSLILPANEATDQSLTPSLDWTNVQDATIYNLQVASCSDPPICLVLEKQGLTASEYTVGADVLSPASTYHWRVNAGNTETTSEWTPTFKFTTEQLELFIPDPISPAIGAADIGAQPALCWSNVPAALSYHLQVATSPGFFAPYFDRSGIPDTCYQLSDLSINTVYYWRVRAENISGSSGWSDLFYFTTGMTVEVENTAGEIPVRYRLGPNYPNPFNPVTQIPFDIPRSGRVLIRVFSTQGNEVIRLVDDFLPAGAYTIEWKGETSASGVYLCRMESESFSDTIKITLVK